MLALIIEAFTADEVGAGRSPRAIAAVIGRMITNGTLPEGTRMPTVRQVSRALGVSPTTVSEAWKALVTAGAIETRGRNGTIIRAGRPMYQPLRYRGISAGPGRFELDLSSGIPDPDLLPDLAPIVARVSRQSLTSSYLDHPVLPELAELLAESWPFSAERLTVVDGALDALDRVGQLILRLGDRVIVEDPCFPPLLDLLERLGCEVIGVGIDHDGIRTDELEVALTRDPTALFLQPRAQNPTSVAMSQERAGEIAALVADNRTIIVEDDHANEISAAPLVSLGSHLPARTIHIRSFSKSHGPDLRLAAIGGAGEILDSLDSRRLLGPGWSSRILQTVLVELIGDAAATETLAVARWTYAHRRSVVSAALDAAGIVHHRGDGVNLWMPVDHEQSALVTLASQGVGAAPGEPFMLADTGSHLRVTVGLIPEQRLAETSDLLVEAAVAGGAPVGSR